MLVLSPAYHPQPDEKGAPCLVEQPTAPTDEASWLNSGAYATFSATHGGMLPEVLNGVPFTKETLGGKMLSRLLKRYAHFSEPPLPATKKRLTSGLVIAEPDGRFWLVHPTNRYAGVAATFRKGRLDAGLTLVVNAVKESWEESGLIAEPVAWLCDIDRTKTVTRYYIAKRTGGTPENVGWESQAVSLVPADALLDFLNRPNDLKILPYLARWRACAERA